MLPFNDNFGTSSTRYSSVYHLHHQPSFPSTFPHKVMQNLLSWRKSKRNKEFLRNSGSYNDLCVIMKREQSTRIFTSDDSNNTTNHISQYRQECRLLTNSSLSPVVSFINQGDGFISMQLMDRVMINENELYSMSLADHSWHSGTNKPSSISTSNASLVANASPPTPPLRNDSLYDNDNEMSSWFHGSIHRDKAIKMLQNTPFGAFIVRYSTTKQNCYALSVRVPFEYQPSGISHYLIMSTPNGTFKIKGFTKEFPSLKSLIVHHSIMQELLPCTLKISNNSIKKGVHEVKTKCQQEDDSILSNDEEVLVDVDSDPDYQRILTHFRKTMSRCK